MSSDLNFAQDATLIAILQQRGYSIRRSDEGKPLVWTRTGDAPNGRPFKEEALDKIKEMLSQEHLHFSELKERVSSPYAGLIRRSARLIIL